MTSKIDILIDAEFKGAGAKTAVKELENVGKASDKADNSLDELATTAGQASNQLDKLAGDVQETASAATSAAMQVDKLSTNVTELATDTNTASTQIDELTAEIKETGTTAGTTSSQVDKLAKSTEKAGSSVEKAGKKAAQSESEWKRFKDTIGQVGAGITAAGAAILVAYKALSAGAELDAARQKLDNLAKTIDTTGASLLKGMRGATKGMVSDAALIAGATDVINVGLAKTEGQAVRMATVISGLGLDMQQVILTFANNSKARLDSLGLSIDAVNERTEELKKQGLDLNEAFDTAVLELLEEKMVVLGDASLTTAGKLVILETSFKNMANSALEAVATSGLFTKSLNEFAAITTMQNKLSDIRLDLLTRINRAVELGLVSQSRANDLAREYTETGLLSATDASRAAALEELEIWEQRARNIDLATEARGANSEQARRSLRLDQETIANTRKLAEREDTEARITQQLKIENEAYQELNAAVKEGINQQNIQRRATQDAADARESHRIALQALREEEARFAGVIQGNSERVNAYGQVIGGLAGSYLPPLQNQTADLTAQLLEQAGALGISQTQFALLAMSATDATTGQRLYSDAAIETALENAIMAEKIKEVAQAVSDGDMSIATARDTLTSFQDGLSGSSQMAEALGVQVSSTTDKLNNLPEEVDVDIKGDAAEKLRAIREEADLLGSRKRAEGGVSGDKPTATSTPFEGTPAVASSVKEAVGGAAEAMAGFATSSTTAVTEFGKMAGLGETLLPIRKTLLGGAEGGTAFAQSMTGAFNAADTLNSSVITVRDAIANLPKNVEIVFTSDLSGFQVPGGMSGGGVTTPGNNAPEFARGGSFTVPSGYPNDTFPMRVQSGEHVQVTPAGQSPTTQGKTVNVYVTVMGALDPMTTGNMVASQVANRLGSIA